jgi:hypothetical protein
MISFLNFLGVKNLQQLGINLKEEKPVSTSIHNHNSFPKPKVRLAARASSANTNSWCCWCLRYDLARPHYASKAKSFVFFCAVRTHIPHVSLWMFKMFTINQKINKKAIFQLTSLGNRTGNYCNFCIFNLIINLVKCLLTILLK